MARLPNHPKAGLLRRVLQRNCLIWLERVIPQDFQQEVALFLLEWSPEAIEADLKNFFRSAQRHFYKVAVDYGFKRPRGSSQYINETTMLDPLEDAEEDSCERKAAIQHWYSQENSLQLREYLELCKRVLTNGSGKTDWYGFQVYLSGCNLNEIAFLTGWKVSQVKENLRGIVRRIREAAGVDPSLPMPPMPKRGKVEFRQGWNLGAGSRPARGDRARHLAGEPRALANLPLREIMQRFGVSKATASRIRRRGWFVPGHHKV